VLMRALSRFSGSVALPHDDVTLVVVDVAPD
jgi:hypothetical protein